MFTPFTKKVVLESYIDPIIFANWQESAKVRDAGNRPKYSRKDAENRGQAAQLGRSHEEYERSLRDELLPSEGRAIAPGLEDGTRKLAASKTYKRLKFKARDKPLNADENLVRIIEENGRAVEQELAAAQRPGATTNRSAERLETYYGETLKDADEATRKQAQSESIEQSGPLFAWAQSQNLVSDHGERSTVSDDRRSNALPRQFASFAEAEKLVPMSAH